MQGARNVEPLSIQVVEGKGYFLGEGDAKIPAEKGDILISEIREPHGVKAETNMRIVVTIAPPIWPLEAVAKEMTGIVMIHGNVGFLYDGYNC